MTTATIILVLVLTALIAWTIRTVANGGTGNPPRSHTRDRNFLPPSALPH
jgi:hypothetical protein